MNMEFEKEQEQQNQNIQVYQTEPEDESQETKAPDLDDIDDDIEVPEEDQQLDLFGDIQPVSTKKTEKSSSSKKEKKETKAEIKKTTSKAKTIETVGAEFTVYYAGHKIPVPKDNMTLEEVREFLEGDFPELSSERTEMTIDKDKKHIVPVVKGAKKG